jgi:primosomal protein N' (replication factor Y) (superfamily II helicase)
MHRFARVVVESNLLQLDREFDFLVPDSLQQEIGFGQRVKFGIGRSKKIYTGFVVGLPEQSDFANSELHEIVDPRPVLSEEILQLARQVADRQCVAIGEVLALAIPDHMPRIELAQSLQWSEPGEIVAPKIDHPLGSRSALLCSARSFEFAGELWPDWALIFISEAATQLRQGKSALLIVPENSQARLLAKLAKTVGISNQVLLGGEQKKAERFRSFQQLLDSDSALVIGTRNAIYAPLKNLGLIALFDDLDDSLREQGSPFTHARETALMRASSTRLLLAANYRSVEVERLVQIGYLSDHTVVAAPPRISFRSPD